MKIFLGTSSNRQSQYWRIFKNIVTGRRDKVNFWPFGARFQSPVSNIETNAVGGVF